MNASAQLSPNTAKAASSRVRGYRKAKNPTPWRHCLRDAALIPVIERIQAENTYVYGLLDVACPQTRRLDRGARTIPSLAVEGDLPDSRRASRLPQVGDNLERSWDQLHAQIWLNATSHAVPLTSCGLPTLLTYAQRVRLHRLRNRLGSAARSLAGQ